MEAHAAQPKKFFSDALRQIGAPTFAPDRCPHFQIRSSATVAYVKHQLVCYYEKQSAANYQLMKDDIRIAFLLRISTFFHKKIHVDAKVYDHRSIGRQHKNWINNVYRVVQINFTFFTRHKFLTVKEWLKSVLNYRSYHKNKTGYPFLDHPVY